MAKTVNDDGTLEWLDNLSNGVDGNIIDCVVVGTYLYVFGNFTYVGGTNPNQGESTDHIYSPNLAKYNLTTSTWEAINTKMEDDTNLFIISAPHWPYQITGNFAVNGTDIYFLANICTKFNGISTRVPSGRYNRVCKIDTTTNTYSIISNTDFNESIQSPITLDNNIYMLVTYSPVVCFNTITNTLSNIGTYSAGGPGTALVSHNGAFYISGDTYNRYSGYYGEVNFIYEMSYNQVNLSLDNKIITTLTPIKPSAIVSVDSYNTKNIVNVFSSTESFLNF
jgi:hypothetical protein